MLIWSLRGYETEINIQKIHLNNVVKRNGKSLLIMWIMGTLNQEI